MAYEMVMPYHLHMPSYFLETFTEYPILGVSIIMALLTVTAALAGWWLGASLPLDISDTTRQIAALLTASACTWILYIVSRKVLTKISLKPY